MTNLDDNIVNRRVLVDWDGDGWYNEGVAKSTPPNLFPNALYPTRTNIKGYNTALTAYNFTDTPENSVRGLVKRSVRLGDQATSVRFMFDDFLTYQPREGDPVNLIQPSAAFASYPFGNGTNLWLQTGGKPTGSINGYWGIPVPTPNDNGRLGFNVLKLAYDPTLGGVFHSLGYERSGTGGNFNYYANTAPFAGVWTYVANSGESLVWSGMPVQPNQQYTLTFWVYLPAESVDLTFAGGSPTVYPYIYSSQSTSWTGYPYYNRDSVASTGGTVINYNQWTKFQYTFTIPNWAFGTKNLAIDLQIKNSITGAAYLGGLMLMQGSQNPTRFWDSNISFSDEQFSYVFPGDSQDYTVSYMVRSPNGITKLKPTRKIAVLGTNTIASTVLSDVVVTSDWTRVDFTVPASTDRRGAWLQFTAEKSGVPVDASHAGDVEFSAFQIVAGTTTYPFHAGQLYGYEDISDYVLSVSTKSGNSEFNDAVPSEGTADIALNNDDKRFSPSNTDSPMYGYLKSNLKTKIQVWDNNNSIWNDVWSGWTYQYDVTPGRNQNRQATLLCQQGVYRLSEGTLQVPTMTDTTADLLAKAIVSASGFRSAANVLQSPVGLHTLVGANAYTADDVQIYDNVDTGVNRIEITGKDWSSGTDPRKALEDTLAAENAMMFLNRDGTISIFNRDHWITDVPSDVFRLDTEVNQAEYVYGREIINGAEVTITDNKQNSAETVWKTKRPVRVNAGQIWVVDLNPQYTEGRTKSVISYTTVGMVKTVYTKDIGMTGDTTDAAADQDQITAVTVELLGDASSHPQVRIVNSNPLPMWVLIEVKGTYLEAGDSYIVKVEDETSVNELQGKHIVTFSSPILTDPTYAASYGEFRMLRQSEPHGEFASFKITVRNQEDLDRVLALGVGDMVEISELQSTEEGKLHAIIGEDFEITDSKTLSVTFHTARTLQEDFAKVDVAVAGDGSINILEDMYAVKPRLDATVTRVPGTAYGLDNDVLILESGTYGNGYFLNPSPGQYEIIKAEDYRYKWQRWPWLDSLNASITPYEGYGAPITQRTAAPYYGYWIMPKNVRNVYWMTRTPTRQVPTNAALAQMTVGLERNKITNDPVAPPTAWRTFIPVTPDATYIVNSYSLLNSYANNPYFGSQPSGQTLLPLDQQNQPLQYWGRSGAPTFFFGLNVQSATAYEAMAYASTQFVSLKQDFTPVGTLGFKLYEKANAYEPEGIIMLDLIRYDRNDAGSNRLVVQPSEGYYYTVFYKLDYGSPLPTVGLSGMDEQNNYSFSGGSNAHTLYSPNIQKLSMYVYPGSGLFAGVNVQLSVNSGVPYVGTKIVVLAHGMSRTDPSTPQELVAQERQDLIYT